MVSLVACILAGLALERAADASWGRLPLVLCGAAGLMALGGFLFAAEVSAIETEAAAYPGRGASGPGEAAARPAPSTATRSRRRLASAIRGVGHSFQLAGWIVMPALSTLALADFPGRVPFGQSLTISLSAGVLALCLHAGLGRLCYKAARSLERPLSESIPGTFGPLGP